MRRFVTRQYRVIADDYRQTALKWRTRHERREQIRRDLSRQRLLAEARIIVEQEMIRILDERTVRGI